MNEIEVKKIRNKIGVSQEKLAEMLGVSLRTVQNYESGGMIPKSKHAILHKLNSKTQKNSEAKQLTDIDFMNIPFIPVHAQAGYGRGYGDQEYIDNLPTIPVIVDKKYRGKYRVFEVEGDSMDNNTRDCLCNGDKVLGREVKFDLWKSKLHYNDWYFVIVTKRDGVLTKQIINHDVENGVVTCHSLNPIFEDFEVNLNDVSELYNVIKIVDRNTRI